ncbi:hypothetical protein TSAR_011013 [Trichomalopsis sarcophagae]|uniref:Uncharacterized protein n=1 Tax=Trichomalopsis sarcophagae TaxID=543379 RepID=A0A232EF51_9HYME|nr:hypothetical protein TSAR_011013 [Trichomalopsis sarcophagae]
MIEAINELNTTARFFTTLTLHNHFIQNFEKSLVFFIVPIIKDFSPIQNFSREKIKIPSHLKLADTNFYKPSKVDMLLGVGPILDS